MPLIATKGNAGAFAYGFTAGGAPEVLGGMVLMTPTSVAKTGTGSTATIGTNGSVEFSSCETLSLNGVFNTDYDNYMVVMRNSHTLDGQDVDVRLRSSGTDASGSNYSCQKLGADSSTISGYRYSSIARWYGFYSGTGKNGSTMNVYGPYLSQPTAYRLVNVGQYTGAGGVIQDWAGTHSLSSSYDGLSFIPASTYSISGLVSVYGLVGT